MARSMRWRPAALALALVAMRVMRVDSSASHMLGGWALMRLILSRLSGPGPEDSGFLYRG